jgi:hypothetical protein
LIGAKARETGAMMHLATPELDRGPVVTYCTFPITGEPFDTYRHEIENRDSEAVIKSQGETSPLFRLIREHGLKREFPLILATMKAFSQGKVRIIRGRVVDPEGKPINGYNLTVEIDKLVKGNAQEPNLYK